MADKTRNGILAGGNWIIDKVKIVDTFPDQDGLANILEQTSGNGGSPYNMMMDLSKMKTPFPLAGVGVVGEDEDGRRILSDCKAAGIDASQIHTTKEASTSYTDVFTVRSTGRRTFFHHRGANALFDDTHIDFGASKARIFHLGYMLLLDRMDEILPDGKTRAAKVLEKAKEAGFMTTVDVVSEASDRFAKIVIPTLPAIDLLLCNEYEAEKTTGVKIRTPEGCDLKAIPKAAAKLLENGVNEWVVVHVPEGVYARSVKGEEMWQGSVKMPAGKIAGTVGAGDALAAGLLYGVHEGMKMQESLRLGVCTAASCLLHPTTSGGVLPKEECLKLGEQYGFRPVP